MIYLWNVSKLFSKIMDMSEDHHPVLNTCVLLLQAYVLRVDMALNPVFLL